MDVVFFAVNLDQHYVQLPTDIFEVVAEYPMRTIAQNSTPILGDEHKMGMQ